MKNNMKNIDSTVGKLKESRPYINKLAIPAALVVGAVAIACAYPAYASTGSSTLPNISTQNLVTKILSAKTPIYAGTVQESINSGLPASIINTFTQTNTKNVAASVFEKAVTGGVSFNYWDNGSGNFRVQIPMSSSEIDLYKLGSTTWIYNSSSNSVTKATRNTRLPSPAQHQNPTRHQYVKRLIKHNPNTFGKNILSKLPKGATETVSSGPYVASQPTYTLTINTNDSNSSIKDIRIAVDANTFKTLGVYVDSYKASTIFSMDYSMLSYQKPTNSVFAYSPAKGTTVHTVTGRTTEPRLRKGFVGSFISGAIENQSVIGIIEKLVAPGLHVASAPGRPTMVRGFIPPPTIVSANSGGSASSLPAVIGAAHAGISHSKLSIMEILSSVPSDLGISPAALRSDLQSGKSLASIAAANNISPSTLINELVTTFTKNTNSEITSGALPKDQANKLLSHLTSFITNIVNNPLPAPGRGNLVNQVQSGPNSTALSSAGSTLRTNIPGTVAASEPKNPPAAPKQLSANPGALRILPTAGYPARIIGSGFSTVTIVNAPPKMPSHTIANKADKASPLLKGIKTIGTPETTSLGTGYLISLNFGSIFVANNCAMAFGNVPSHVLLHDIM